MVTWDNGGNSYKIHLEFFKISVHHTSGKFNPSAKLTERQILPVGSDTGRIFFFQNANSHVGVDGGATVAFITEVKRCHCFFLYIA